MKLGVRVQHGLRKNPLYFTEDIVFPSFSFADAERYSIWSWQESELNNAVHLKVQQCWNSRLFSCIIVSDRTNKNRSFLKHHYWQILKTEIKIQQTLSIISSSSSSSSSFWGKAWPEWANDEWWSYRKSAVTFCLCSSRRSWETRMSPCSLICQELTSSWSWAGVRGRTFPLAMMTCFLNTPCWSLGFQRTLFVYNFHQTRRAVMCHVLLGRHL